MSEGGIHLSVVSHNQDDLVNQLLHSLAACCGSRNLVITVTRNTAAAIPLISCPFPLHVVTNPQPRGFGANHNQAFTGCREEFFCVINPDILLLDDPFPALLSALSSGDVGVVAPLLVDSRGIVQDSARKFPTPFRIVSRMLRKQDKRHEYSDSAQSLYFPDWVAGMFMLFPAALYRDVGGFDERFFMYCEDADICRRLAVAQKKTRLVTTVRAVHNPRRASHKTMSHLRWHLASLLRFFLKYPFYTL